VTPSEHSYPAMAYLRPKMGGIYVEAFDDAHEDNQDIPAGNV